MQNEETETYSNKDFGKDVAKIVIKTAAEVVAAHVLIAGIGITVIQVQKFRARRDAKKTESEE